MAGEVGIPTKVTADGSTMDASPETSGADIVFGKTMSIVDVCKASGSERQTRIC